MQFYALETCATVRIGIVITSKLKLNKKKRKTNEEKNKQWK